MTVTDFASRGEREPDLFSAIEHRESGMARVTESSSNTEYVTAFEQAIRTLALSGREFTADDVREIAGSAPIGVHFNIAGALMNAAARSGLIVHCGYAISARVAGHGNLVRKWRGAA